MVKTGLDILVHEQTEILANQRVGLVSMPAAVLPDLTLVVGCSAQCGHQGHGPFRT